MITKDQFKKAIQKHIEFYIAAGEEDSGTKYWGQFDTPEKAEADFALYLQILLEKETKYVFAARTTKGVNLYKKVKKVKKIKKVEKKKSTRYITEDNYVIDTKTKMEEQIADCDSNKTAKRIAKTLNS